MIVRCQALRPGRSSRYLHSTQPRTWQARFVDFRTAAVCALSRGPRSRSVSRNLRWSSDGRSRGLCRFAYPTIPFPLPDVAPLLSFVATRCGDRVFLWRRSMRPFFCSLVATTSQPAFFVKQGMSVVSSLGFTTLMSLGGPVGALIGMWLGDRWKPAAPLPTLRQHGSDHRREAARTRSPVAARAAESSLVSRTMRFSRGAAVTSDRPVALAPW